MQALKLTLDFCHIRGRHRRTAATRINRREAFPSPISPDQEKECLPQSNESRQAHVKATSKFDRDHSSTPSNITNDMILDQDSGTSSLPSFSKHASQSTEVSDVPLAVSIPRKPKRPRELFPAVSCKTPSPTSNLNLRSMVALTDAALRTIICDKPMRTALGIKVSSQGNSTKLEKLAPTLWSPGYLSAVAQRAQFLPIAANAICSIHGRTSFPIIKRKLAALASWSSSRPPGHPQIQDDSAILDLAVPHAIRKAAKAGLWKILQHGVYDPGAARRLKPLKLPDPTSPSASSMQNSEMLEEDNFPNLLDDDIPVLLDEEERGWLASQDSDISLFEYLDDEDAVIEEKDYEDKFIDLEAEGCWYDDGVDQEATDTIGGMMEDDFELQPDASNDDLFCPQILEHQQQSNEALTPQFHNGNMILEQESDTCGMIPRHQDADIILEQGFDFDSIPLEIRDGELMLL
ncbi:MAG: hypothetical protein M1827_002917 [Pycnora praestabilis]|nr:MAG: hypothetical protein M1827_002917 [Pycnora praestabilis]